MNILSIDTSCDETSVAVTDGRMVLSNAIYSQVLLHKKWGGVVPSIAKRAHEERIDYVIGEALRKWGKGKTVADTDAIAVTQGPGLAIALEVGMRKAKELSATYGKRIIPVNHLEGHIYSCFVQNGRGNPVRPIEFPYLSLIVSGGHTELVVMRGHVQYEVIGETIDDAAGEALDKAAKMLGLGYPGGAAIERLANGVGNTDKYRFPRPMAKSDDLRFSFSGLKTALYYFLKKMDPEDIARCIGDIASSFQEAVFSSILIKTERAVKETRISRLAVGGGVAANRDLRKRMRRLVSMKGGSVVFPPYPYLTGDNAAMIGVAAHYKAEKGIFVADPAVFDRIPRYSLPIYDL